MKKALSLILALALCMGLLAVPAAARQSGVCGESLVWRYAPATGTLIVSGTGTMDNYRSDYRAPWHDLGDIRTVVIERGVRSIGKYAFSGCEGLTGVTIPNSVRFIGDSAFSGCVSLTRVTIPAGVTELGADAFYGCEALSEVTLSAGLKEIDAEAFFNCLSLTRVEIPNGVTDIGTCAFYGCAALRSVTLPDGLTEIGEFAFASCNSLARITIPASVTFLAFGAVVCKDIDYPGTPEQWEQLNFCPAPGYSAPTVHCNAPSSAIPQPETPGAGVTVDAITVRWTDAAPYIDQNSRTMVPLRAVAEALGLSVRWDAAKREAIFSDGTKTLIFPIDSSKARTGDGGVVEMDTEAVIVPGVNRTYAPIRYLASYFGYQVEWNPAARVVVLRSGAGPASANVTLTRMNHSYWTDEGDLHAFVNCYYDLATVSGDGALTERINTALRTGYEAFLARMDLGTPYAGGYNEGSTNFSYGMAGYTVQNADGILSLCYSLDYWMGGVGDGSPSGLTVSLKTGERIYLSDLTAADGTAITVERLEDIAAAYLLNERGLPKNMLWLSYQGKALDDLNFYLEENQIILCIAKYEAAPGLAGSFLVPTGIFIQT